LSVPVGANTLVLTFQATVLAPGPGVLYLNHSEVTDSDQFDPNSQPDPTPDEDAPTQDDEDTENIVPQQADLSLIKTVNTVSPNVGDVVSFTITVSNAGPNAASGVSIQDLAPAGYSAIAAISGGGVEAPAGTITWSNQSIPVNGNLVLTFNATVDAPTGAAGEYVNLAQVTDSDQYDPNSTPNNGADTDLDGVVGPLDPDDSVDANDENDGDNATVVPQLADLSLVKTISNSAPNVGDVVTFTLTLSNNGTHPGTGVAVQDIVPAGFSAIANISNGGVELPVGTINWTGLNVPVGIGTLVITFDATVDAPTNTLGEYKNTAQITDSDQYDTDSDPFTGFGVDDLTDNSADDDESFVEICVLPCSITGAAAVCAGSAGNSYSAPTGFTVYAWTIMDNGTIVGSTNGQTVIVDAGAPGTFKLTLVITDVNGCTSTCEMVVTVNANPVVTCPADFSTCLDNNPITLTGGLPTGGVYSGTGVSGGEFIPMNAGTGAHTITYTYTDGNGCIGTCTFVITVKAPFDAVIMSQTNPLCNGICNGEAMVAPVGGEAPYTYQWDNDGILDDDDVALATGLCAQTYKVTITDNVGCTAVASVTLIDPAVLVLQVTSTTNTACDGSSTGTGTVSATGGTPPYEYLWPVSAGSQTTATATNLAAGDYIVTVTDDNDCQETVTVTIGSDGPLLLEDPANLNPICPGSDINDILLSATPNNAAIVYTWTGGLAAGLNDGSSTGINPHIPGFVASTTEGTTTVTLTATLFDCESIQTFDITIIDNTPPVITCPANVTVGTDVDKCDAVANYTIPTATDDCPGVVVTHTLGLASGSIFPTSVNTVEYTATDGGGNIVACSFTITVMDMQAPTAVCK
ncbi:MAG: HYR domain-containing protein, partial [Saprospiraceae bacterium]|nr:HYR domain-containing protein [Saprospiraceae bacterium]